MKPCTNILSALSLATLLVFSTACEDDDGDGGGSAISDANDRNLVVCIGDSITQGDSGRGAPYPSQLAAMSGKQVVNMGVGGATASDAPSAARNAIAKKPGYVCILYGSNDAIQGRDPAVSKESLRSAIGVCKAAGVRPVIGTPPSMRDGHALFDGGAKRMADAIRALASEEDVRCVDLYEAFGDGSGLLVADGLHPNADGARLIAEKFNSAL